MEPADIARVPGIHAKRVITLPGSTAVSGLEMITALRPPTRAVRDEASGNWVAGHNPGFAGHRADGPGAAGGHPRAPVVVDSGWNGGFLNEEAYQWVRDVSLLTDEECTLSYAVGSDLNTAFLAAPARLIVDLSTSDHFPHPGVQPKIPGSWLVDLSHVKADPRPPSPFTPDGMRPKGRPAWYQTHTVAYAQEPATTPPRWRRTCAGRPVPAWTHGTGGSGKRTSTPSATSASPSSSPTWSSCSEERHRPP